MDAHQLALIDVDPVEVTPESATAAIHGANRAPMYLVRWLTANDTGMTGSHQAGHHVPVGAWRLFFDRPGQRGENLERFVTIDWTGHGPTESRAIWYGRGTRSEYRLTRFGRDFPFRGEAHVGSLLVMHPEGDHLRAHVLERDDEIDGFLAGAGLTAGDVGGLVVRGRRTEDCLHRVVEALLSHHVTFPSTAQMARHAHEAARDCNSTTAATPDVAIMDWTRVEFELFRAFEDRDFTAALGDDPVDRVERLIELALPFTNRRKARAGRSLEHHVAACLEHAQVPFTAQARTEGRNTMDFVFPSEHAYHDPSHPVDRLVALGAKTSAKERWRQVLEEAERTPVKHLLTLQPISHSTVQQMIERGLHPVVPRPAQAHFEQRVRGSLLSVSEFIDHARSVVAG